MRRFGYVAKLQSLMITIALLACGYVPSAQAQQQQQKKPVVINFGQPNIWSLEQAHYLLARMRARSLGIKTTDLNDLNPNEVNGTRLDIVKTLISAGVGFNQAVGLNNELFENNSRFNQTRRQELLGRRDSLQGQLRDVTVELSRLKIERERMNGSAFTDAQRAQKDVEITETAKIRDLLTSDINATTTEITGLGTGPSAVLTPTPPEPGATPAGFTSVAEKLLENDDFKKNLSGIPKINATTKLDNDINLQYEVIAKQLTLLRDEVGPGQRLVFLELPHTFYTVPDKSKRQLAQVWWRIEGYGKRDQDAPPVPTKDIRAYTTEDAAAAAPAVPAPTPYCGTDPDAWKRAIQNNPYHADKVRTQRQILSDTGLQFMSLNGVGAEREARALDLIPRQSALNVNDIQDRQKNFNLVGLFTLLSGFGARVGFERQQRLYEQFIGQEIYASAFGKGLNEFGWTFGPLPGTDRIATGLHTTYAVLLIPNDAETVTLKARGCNFRRTNYAPENYADTSAPPDGVACNSEKEFKLVVPGTSENNFWVTGVNFKPVKPGDTAVVHIHGDYFSPQIGVLVDGFPLRREVGLAQVELALGRTTHDALFTPPGGFEFVNSKLLVLAFQKPATYRGTPSITLVTPGRAIEINKLRLVINDSYKFPSPANAANAISCYRGKDDPQTYVRLDELEEKMFSPDVALSVTALDAVNFHRGRGLLTAQLSGTGFNPAADVFVNGAPVIARQFVTPGLMFVEFRPPNRDTWNVTVVQGPANARISNTFSVANPIALKVARSEVIRYEAAVKDKADKPGLLLARLHGTGFNSSLVITARRSGGATHLDYTFVSPSEIIVEIKAPHEIEILNLRDPTTGASVGTSVVRPASGT